MSQEAGEKMVLGHEPFPGYRTVFFIVLAVGVLYLGWILFETLGGG
jgi:hypothetical protein